MARKPIKLDHIPREDHEGIGLVANSWSHVEGTVERVIWRLARLNDNRGASITTHMGISARYDAALALARLEFPDSSPTQKLKSIENQIIRTLYGKRNRIVHSRVLHPKTLATWPSLRAVHKARGALRKSLEPIEPGECRQLSDEMLAAATELRNIISEFYVLIEKKDGNPPP